jgi:hypothetical protein
MTRFTHKLYRAVRTLAALVLLGWAGATVQAAELDGTWLLESYVLPAHDLNAAGLMMIGDGHFAMTYTMQAPGAAPSARSHAGTYSVDGDRIVFHVQWWVELVDGVARIVPPVDEGAGLALVDGDTLLLTFGSGGVQTLHRVKADAVTHTTK